jgi:hypothetical protein
LSKAWAIRHAGAIGISAAVSPSGASERALPRRVALWYAGAGAGLNTKITKGEHEGHEEKNENKEQACIYIRKLKGWSLLFETKTTLMLSPSKHEITQSQARSKRSGPRPSTDKGEGLVIARRSARSRNQTKDFVSLRAILRALRV